MYVYKCNKVKTFLQCTFCNNLNILGLNEGLNRFSKVPDSDKGARFTTIPFES